MFGWLRRSEKARRALAWRYVAMVEAKTVFEDSDGEMWGFYIMLRRGRERKYELIGNPGNSPMAMSVKAEVIAWTYGGPMPVNEPEPPQLVLLNGGKGDAA